MVSPKKYSLSRRRFLSQGIAVTALSSRAQGRASDRIGSLTGFPQKKRSAIQDLISDFMKKYSVPGLSIAVSRNGSPVLVEGFGYADQQQMIKVNPSHLFRVASISKPITSVCLFRLIEKGKLKLSDAVFESKNLLSHCLRSLSLPLQQESRLRAVTIQHLLEHTCGGWENAKRDPMFDSMALAMNHRELIHWTIENRSLEHDPGKVYAYSNFGYCLLGRVIEHLMKKSYEDSGQELVFNPSGITRMQIGQDLKSCRAHDEVIYYGQGENPYDKIMRVTRMDSHGGWIATPVDLVRFLLHVDGFSMPKDILQSGSIKSMLQPSTVHPNYSKGWSVNHSHNYWHMGSFNGAAGVLACIHDHFCWAVLVNTRSKKSGFAQDLDRLPWEIRKVIEK